MNIEKMNRRALLVSGAAAVLLTGCSATTTSTYGAPESLPIRSQLLAVVRQLPESDSREVSLRLLNNPATVFYIDEHDLPAARWRGADDLGACVHIRPATKAAYLETQFARAKRADKAPKYIQFGHEGPWYSRRHNAMDKALGTEKNWIDAKSEEQGRALVADLLAALPPVPVSSA